MGEPSVFTWWEIVWLLWGFLYEYRHTLLPALALGGVLFMIRRQTAALKTVVTNLGTQIKSLQDQNELVTEGIGTLRQEFSAVREEVEQSPAASMETQPLSSGPHQNFEQISSAWAATKLAIQRAIDAIPNGQRRKKYSNMSRKNYAPIIEALRRDKVVSDKSADSLLSMSTRHTALKFRKSETTPEDVILFRRWMAIASTELPPETAVDLPDH